MPKVQHIILLGPPASGKGTQGRALSKELCLPILGTGNLLRQAIDRNTELGGEAAGYLARGLYVPDQLIESLVSEWVGENPDGWIFDGFPRTLVQARFIDGCELIAPPDMVIGLKVPKRELERRINSRRQCRTCDVVTSTLVHRLPTCPEPGCIGELYSRNDDAIESFRVRHAQYREHTEPLFDYFDKQGILSMVNGDQELKLVQMEIKGAIEQAAK